MFTISDPPAKESQDSQKHNLKTFALISAIGLVQGRFHPHLTIIFSGMNVWKIIGYWLFQQAPQFLGEAGALGIFLISYLMGQLLILDSGCSRL